MSVLRWAAVAAVAGVLAGDVALAQAQEPAPEPSPTPTPTPSATPTATPTPFPTPFPTPVPLPVPDGTSVYIITVTTTTTAINAPITWVAAPITTNVSNSSSTNATTPNGTGASPPATSLRTSPSGDRARLEVNLIGCGESAASPTAAERAQVRLPDSATLLVRVNQKRVGTIQLPAGKRGVPLRLLLGADGTLTVRRPSGSVMRVKACTPPSKEHT